MLNVLCCICIAVFHCLVPCEFLLSPFILTVVLCRSWCAINGQHVGLKLTPKKNPPFIWNANSFVTDNSNQSKNMKKVILFTQSTLVSFPIASLLFKHLLCYLKTYRMCVVHGFLFTFVYLFMFCSDNLCTTLKKKRSYVSSLNEYMDVFYPEYSSLYCMCQTLVGFFS